MCCVVFNPYEISSFRGDFQFSSSRGVNILPNIFPQQCEIKGLHITLTVILQGNTFMFTLAFMLQLYHHVTLYFHK